MDVGVKGAQERQNTEIQLVKEFATSQTSEHAFENGKNDLRVQIIRLLERKIRMPLCSALLYTYYTSRRILSMWIFKTKWESVLEHNRK